MSMNTVPERLAALRAAMDANGVDLYLIPVGDPHSSEYLPDHYTSLTYFSGFHGENSNFVVTRDKSALWADGRYFVQAEKEIAGTEIELERMGEPGVPTVEQYCADALPEGGVLGLCGLTASCQLVRSVQKALDAKHGTIKTLNLEDELWTEGRPALPETPAWLLSKEYAGFAPAEKLEQLRAKLKELGCTAQLVGKLDNLAWLLNLRAMDIQCTPYAMAYCYVTGDRAVLFINTRRLGAEAAAELKENGVEIAEYDDILTFLAAETEAQTVLADPASVNYAVYETLHNNPALTVKDEADPLLPMKGVKNETELNHDREAHLRDAVAMVRFQKELEERLAAGEELTELTVDEILHKYRSAQDKFIVESFGTIAAYGGNAAMMHYHATEEDHAKLEKKGFLLVDSGATYMDGTTAVVDLSKMTYFDDTASGVVAPKIATGKVTHSTGIQNKVMKVDGDYFYVDSYINTNAVCDVNGILNGHLFQFTTQANGTLAAVEVATGVDAKFFNENLFVSKNTQYNGKNLIVDDATVFLVRNNTTNPYTFKSIVGLGNIDNYAQAEVDFVDLNGDKVADYVYVIADPVAAKVTSLFYYANEQVSYDAKTGVYTIPGYVDGVKGNIYGSKDDAIVLTLLNALRTQATNKVAGGLFKVALSNNYVKDYVAIAAIGTESSTTAAITAFTGYPMAAAYAGYTVKVDSIVGADKDTYKNSVYTDYVDGTITGDKFYTVSGNGVDGLTKMPLALGDVTTQNVIVVYNADPAGTSATLNRLALQVYAVNKVDTSTNPDPLATSYTYTLNIVNKDTGAVLQSYAKTVKNPVNGTYTITLAGAANEFGVSTAKLTAFGPDSITLTIDSTVGKLTDSGVLNAYYAN